MALSERTKTYMGILDDGQIELRRTRVILDGGEVIGERHHRQVLEPGQDVTLFPARVRRISEAVWTPQVIADYLAAKAVKLPIQPV